MSELVVEARSVVRRFGAQVAVDRLDLAIKPGEIFGLVGPDGAGKTTTLRLLCGLLEPQAGEIRVLGFDPVRQPEKVRDRIGYMAQRFGLYSDLTVDENLAFYADLFGVSRAERERLMSRLLEMTRLGQFRDRQAGRLSGGMRQKLALMCTLIHRPRLLILDEPTNGVDPLSRRDFWEILNQLAREGMTVLTTTAYLDEAERCHRIGLMYKGRLIRSGRPAEIIAAFEEPCYSLSAPDLRAARRRLESSPEVESVEPFGDRLHLFLTPGRGSPEDVASALEREGLGPVEMRPLAPTLEDVFILAIRKAAREGA